MPRRELLTAAKRKALLAFPEEEENLLQYSTLSIRDLAPYANIAASTIASALRFNFVTSATRARFLQKMRRRRQHFSDGRSTAAGSTGSMGGVPVDATKWKKSYVKKWERSEGAKFVAFHTPILAPDVITREIDVFPAERR
jgi:hypothetical protein